MFRIVTAKVSWLRHVRGDEELRREVVALLDQTMATRELIDMAAPPNFEIVETSIVLGMSARLILM